jgi:hypothetical protein
MFPGALLGPEKILKYTLRGAEKKFESPEQS